MALTSHRSTPKFSAQPTASPSPAPCFSPPPRIATPAWFPKDLPLPANSYAVRYQLASLRGYKQAVFVAGASLQDFVKHALNEWPKQGWVLGRGDSEPGEAEDTFTKQREARFGAFRATAVLCDPKTTFVYFVVGTIGAPTLSSPSPTGSHKPLKP